MSSSAASTSRALVPRPRTKATLAVAAALVLTLSATVLLAPPVLGAFDPAGPERSTALASGKCSKKKTKRKRRACRNRRRLSRLAGDFGGSLGSTIRYLTFCYGDLGSQSTQVNNVRVSVRAPLRPTPLSPDLPPAAGNENNPINLVVGQTTTEDNIAPGSVFLSSAFRYGATSPGVILQSWNLTLRGAALSGTLTEDHREEAAAQNLLSAWKELGCAFNFWYPNQYAIAEGTTLTGTLTRNAVQLRIVGNTIDGSRPFVTEISASRPG